MDQRARRIRAVFDRYDVDRSGTISLSELENLLRDLQFPSHAVEDAFISADCNSDGMLSFEEFVPMYNKVREQLAQSAAPAVSTEQSAASPSLRQLDLEREAKKNDAAAAALAAERAELEMQKREIEAVRRRNENELAARKCELDSRDAEMNQMMAELRADQERSAAENKRLQDEHAALQNKLEEMESDVRMGRASQQELDRLQESMSNNEAELALLQKQLVEDHKMEQAMRSASAQKGSAAEKAKLQARLAKKRERKRRA